MGYELDFNPGGAGLILRLSSLSVETLNQGPVSV